MKPCIAESTIRSSHPLILAALRLTMEPDFTMIIVCCEHIQRHTMILGKYATKMEDG
jgi:hypothetical protein